VYIILERRVGRLLYQHDRVFRARDDANFAFARRRREHADWRLQLSRTAAEEGDAATPSVFRRLLVFCDHTAINSLYKSSCLAG
jgi:hypothetical protein